MVTNNQEPPISSSINENEVRKFNVLAEEWWDPKGKFKPLHQMNPIRLDYINSQIMLEFDRDLSTPLPFEGLTILDIGCGGGLLTEPMARLGAKVHGIDVAEKNIAIAKEHAIALGLNIVYEEISSEELAKSGVTFDVVLCLEVIEHVNAPQDFLFSCRQLINKNGLFICSTLNRNPKSFLMAILGAEYFLRMLPVGTHDWSKFIKPEELKSMLGNVGFDMVDLKGLVFNPFFTEWSLSARDFDVNYITASILSVPHNSGDL